MTPFSEVLQKSKKPCATGISGRCELRGGSVTTPSLSPASFSTLGVAPTLVGISGVFVPPTASMGVSLPSGK